jgi:hypothetical protein
MRGVVLRPRLRAQCVTILDVLYAWHHTIVVVRIMLATTL